MPEPAASVSRAPVAVIVMGVSGSGKSTVGGLIARALGVPFLEGDSFHSADAIAKMHAGEPLTDADRWPWLDRLGQAIADDLAGGKVVVAACSALRRSYRDRLAQAAGGAVRFVLLAGAHDELKRRLDARKGHYMPASLLDSQLATLEPLQPGEPGLTLDLAQPAEVLCREALDWLAAAG